MKEIVRKQIVKVKKYVLAKDTVIQYYKEHDKVLVIDDFHYASKEMQTKNGTTAQRCN